MNDTLSFAKKIIQTNSNNNDGTENHQFIEIASKCEEKKNLNDIIEIINGDKGDKLLYLVKSSKPDWKFLNDKRKLEYGRIIITHDVQDVIKKAEKRAFIMKDCNMTEIGAEGCRKGMIELNSTEDRLMRTDLTFTGDVDIQDFAKFGLSIGRSKNVNSKFEANSIYNYTEFGKVSLEFSLEATPEFINVVKEAIKSKDPREFKKITESYGQFIPNKVILGGRVYFEGVKNLKESCKGNINKGAVNIGVLNSNIGMEHTSEHSNENANYSKSECFKLIGGQTPESLENFDEATWVKSLKDFRNWDCIGYQKPISIFQLLPDDLRKQVFSSVGKKILHSDKETFKYWLTESGKPEIFELRIPLEILKNEEADCDIFATVVDTSKDSKNDFFTWQILRPTGGQPSLIIHCIQRNFRKRECKLTIGWMVIGYDTDFNSILSDFNAKAQLNILKEENTLNNQIMIKKKT